MTTSKNSFLHHKQDCSWWQGIITSDQFTTVIIHAQAELMEENLSGDQLAGARRMLQILTSLCDEPPKDAPTPRPKLEHDLGFQRPTKPATK